MKNLLLPLGAVLIWSVNAVVNKLAAGAIAPGAISFYRWALALAVMTPFLIIPVWQQRAVIKQHAWKLFVLGFLGMGCIRAWRITRRIPSVQPLWELSPR